MNKKVKLILIIIFALLFFLVCPATILYSQGYRFNFETRKFVKVGGISLRTQPSSCEVYLNGKFKKKTDFIFGSTFIKNLLPNRYNIRVEKEGYSSWEKTLEVKEELVAEANIILFPKTLNFSTLISDIEYYSFSPDEKKIIFKKQAKEGWVLELYNIEEDTWETVFKETDTIQREAFSNLSWHPDSNKIIVETETKYFIVDLEEETIFSLGYLGNIEKITFNPQNSQEIFFLKKLNGSKVLSRSNYSKKELTEPILKDLKAYKIVDEDILLLDSKGLLQSSDLSGENLETLNTVPFSIKDAEYEIEFFIPAIFIKEDNHLYQLNLISETFEKFPEPIRELKLSPNSERLLISSDYGIWILFLVEAENQPQREAGQRIFLTRFSQEINNIFWLTPDYLIFNTGDKIKTAEIDDRDRVNIVEIGEFENPEIYWNQEFKRIYVRSNKEIYFLDNLLP